MAVVAAPSAKETANPAARLVLDWAWSRLGRSGLGMGTILATSLQ